MRNLLTAFFIIVCLVAGMARGANAPDGKLQVKLKPAAVLPAGEISLGQVAEVSAGNAALAAELSALSLGNTPLAGNARTVLRNHVVMYLTRKGIREADINLQGARACTVTVN